MVAGTACITLRDERLALRKGDLYSSSMANGVWHTGYEIVVRLAEPDLGHPNRPYLLAEITSPVGERDRELLECLEHHREWDPAEFLFHARGVGGVGKSTLLRQWQETARRAGAVTAVVDENDVHDVHQALAELGASPPPEPSEDASVAVRRRPSGSALRTAGDAQPRPSRA